MDIKAARSGWAAIVIAALLASVSAVAGASTLELESDVDVVVYIDGTFRGRFDGEETSELEVAPGWHVVWVIAAEAPGVGVQEMFDFRQGDSEELEVELERDVEDWIDSDPDRREHAPWESHLVERLDGTLEDPESELQWAWIDNGSDVDWESAKAYCDGLGLAGRGWRLPSIEELETLVGDDILESGFRIVEPIWVSACCPWSGDEHGSISSWYMGFEEGRRGFVTRDYSEGARALCVRDGGR